MIRPMKGPNYRPMIRPMVGPNYISGYVILLSVVGRSRNSATIFGFSHSSFVARVVGLDGQFKR